MFESAAAPAALAPKKIVLTAVAAVLGCSLGGYAIHEHHTAQTLAAKNAQATAQLSDTQHELSDLTTKVNLLVARAQTQAAAPAAPAPAPAARSHRPSPAHRAVDSRYKKLQAQLDAQGRAIQDTQNALAGTRTELTGSIAHTHDELVLLEKRGERNYTEFDINKSKQFQHKGPFGLRLKKANVKHQFADLELIVDDRTLQQKHINLYQPVMFSTPDSPQIRQVRTSLHAGRQRHRHRQSRRRRQRRLVRSRRRHRPHSRPARPPQAPDPHPAITPPLSHQPAGGEAAVSRTAGAPCPIHSAPLAE